MDFLLQELLTAGNQSYKNQHLRKKKNPVSKVSKIVMCEKETKTCRPFSMVQRPVGCCTHGSHRRNQMLNTAA